MTDEQQPAPADGKVKRTVPNKHKAKGDRAELEIAKRLTDILGYPVRRKLGAGRALDVGDIDGIYNWVVQVKNRRDIARTIREGMPQLERQRQNAGVKNAALLVRQQGGNWLVCLTLEQWTWLLKQTPHHHQQLQQHAPAHQQAQTIVQPIIQPVAPAHEIAQQVVQQLQPPTPPSVEQ